jgi:hypothetical protein
MRNEKSARASRVAARKEEVPTACLDAGPAVEHREPGPKGMHLSFCGGPIWCDCKGCCRLRGATS